MSVIQAVVLALVQGLTEFFPVSSSGHLELSRWLFGWELFAGQPELEKTFDVAVHLGTLTGAVAYFRADLARFARSGVAVVFDAERRRRDTDGRTAWLLALSVLPAVVTGVVLEDVVEGTGDDARVVAVMLIVFGLILAWADRLPSQRPATSYGLRDALLMGLGQALALQPGVSRSGVTITVGRRLGFGRDAATRLSFLMSIPVIAGAGVYSLVDTVDTGVPAGFRVAFAVGVAVSAATGWLAVWATLRIVRSRSFDVFVRYRVVLGLGVLALAATPWR